MNSVKLDVQLVAENAGRIYFVVVELAPGFDPRKCINLVCSIFNGIHNHTDLRYMNIHIVGLLSLNVNFSVHETYNIYIFGAPLNEMKFPKYIKETIRI